MFKHFESLHPDIVGENSALNLMHYRMGGVDLPKYKPDTVEGSRDMAKRL
jgi:hypothetical protein